MDDVNAYLDGDEVARARLIALGGGVHSFAFDLAPLDDGHPDAAVYDIGDGEWASADGAADMFTAVEHERVVELAGEWLRRHARRVTATVNGFSAGQIAISEQGSWPFRARWRVSGGVIERLDTPVRIKKSSTRQLEVTPSGSPDVGNDSADLAVFCATIAASLGIKADVAALGDIFRSGTVLADGSIEPQLDAARGRVRHLLVPSNTRYLAGERQVQLVYDDHRLHGLHVWTAETIDDAALLLLDAAAGEEHQRTYPNRHGQRRRVQRLILLVAAIAAVIMFVAPSDVLRLLAGVSLFVLVLLVITTTPQPFR
jgi:hypothetical protein